MLTNNQLYETVEGYGSRYPRLQRQFQTFAQYSAQLATHQEYFPGLKFEVSENDGFFEATYLGRVFQVAFVAVADDNDKLGGYAWMSERDRVSGRVLNPSGVCHFRFDDRGETTLQAPDGSGTLKLYIDMAAQYLFLHMLRLALRINPLPPGSSEVSSS